jgi:hypothetical protein
VKCEFDLTVDFVRCVLHFCGQYIKKEDGRKERKQFRKDLFSRIAKGWHGKCWGSKWRANKKKNFFA